MRMHELFPGLFTFEISGMGITQGEFLVRLAVALGIGFMIGLEREHSTMISREDSFAGIRTFIFLVLLGFFGAMLQALFSPWMLPLLFTGVVVFTGIAYWNTASRGDIGGTTEFTALLAFFLGSFTFAGYIAISLILTVIIVLILSLKVRLHSMIGKISSDEMFSIVQYVVAAVLIFPFLPDIQMGPNGIVNPKEIGITVLILSGVGFLGYMLTKFLGRKSGSLAAGLIGGMVSSTMITWVYARKSNESEHAYHDSSTAIFLASAVMILRVFFWLILFHPALILISPLSPSMLMFLVCNIWFARKSYINTGLSSEDVIVNTGKPLDLKSALVFAGLYTIILMLVSYTGAQDNQAGMYITGFIAGLTDLDAITISVSRLSGQQFSEIVAVNTILLASLANTLFKMGISYWAGSVELRKLILKGFLYSILLGITGYLISQFI